LPLLFIPIRTDSPIRRGPSVNRLLIALNVAAFVFTDLGRDWLGPALGEILKTRLMLDPRNLEPIQFFTYQFLHGDFIHLLGNMVFLWVFGNSVNSKMGNLAYLLFYLAGGVFAGVGFSIGGDSPCMGASGAVAAVTTAYLVLFPMSEITTFYWIFFYVGLMRISAVTLIVVKIILWDNIIAPRLASADGLVQVAYSAHIAGYLFGFVICSLMLLVRALPRDQFDAIAMIKRFYQRRQFRSAMADPNVRARAILGRVATPISPITGRPIEPEEIPQDSEIVRIRSEIAELLANREYDRAAEQYMALIARDPKQVLPRAGMLYVANQLMTLERYAEAAGAYEKFLASYPTDNEAQQVKLILGILYAKYLQKPENARPYLVDCLARLTNPIQIQQANQWLDVVTSSVHRGPAPA
jgi:membrane associated rhomboid family serine protease